MAGRILIIEDNPANLELMSYLLASFGHAVIAATNGRQGLELAMRENPDLILCDLRMPVVDGYEVARRLAADSALGRIPLVAVTAFAMESDRDRVLESGFDGYLAKPIDPQGFVDSIEKFLPAALRGRRTSPVHPEPGTDRERQAAWHTVLVVDDRPGNLELARAILEQSRCRVLVASGRSAAMAVARETPPDLIVSDVCMEDGSGYDLIRDVKADPRLASIPFVFLTSTMTSEREREKGLSLGAAKFLFRPIESADLLRELQACLRAPNGT